MRSNRNADSMPVVPEANSLHRLATGRIESDGGSTGAGGGIAVLVVAAPPLIGRGFRPALGRILPILLAAERRQVEEGPGAAERLDAAPGGEVGAEDSALVIAQQDAEAEGLAVVGGDAEVGV